MTNNSQYWTQRNEMAAKAVKHTKDMDNRYKKDIDRTIKLSTIYDNNKIMNCEFGETTNIIVVDKDTVSAAFDYYTPDMAILNFASYKEPGGMFIEGSKAQEECICHESDLYNVLTNFPAYYEYNNTYKNKALYTNRAIYSPDIVFERKVNEEPDTLIIRCGVITCAAPNKTTAQKYCNVTDKENSIALRDRIKFILEIASDNNIKTLILGALGCGVFGQDPNEVASIFKSLLKKYKFETVIFAVPTFGAGVTNPNYNAFVSTFN